MYAAGIIHTRARCISGVDAYGNVFAGWVINAPREREKKTVYLWPCGGVIYFKYAQTFAWKFDTNAEIHAIKKMYGFFLTIFFTHVRHRPWSRRVRRVVFYFPPKNVVNTRARAPVHINIFICVSFIGFVLRRSRPTPTGLTSGDSVPASLRPYYFSPNTTSRTSRRTPCRILFLFIRL